jgi:uncharacterized protein (UPF0264 family)
MNEPSAGGPARPTRLLVSIRSAAEAEAALEGGAEVIDVKEPARGPLGRADEAVIAAVVRQVAGRRPVSAALGELVRTPEPPTVTGLTFIKWGLAGTARRDWRALLERQMAELAAGPRVVVVAYADWQAAAAPPLVEVVGLALAHPGSVLLLDTFDKGSQAQEQRPRTLLDFVPAAGIASLCARCRPAAVQVALAGSLGRAEIAALLPAQPDFIAVRGGACSGGRGGCVCANKVRRLADLVQGRESAAV